jgi:hypothetical protein
MKQWVIFSLVLVLIGCTKFGKNMTVKGRVLNPITGEGIPNAPVIMYRSTLDYPSGSKRVKETTTDSEGYFEISKASLSKCYLTCHVTEVGDYYPIGWEKKDDVPLFDAFTISIKKGKTMHADYYAVPYGNLILNIQNVNCGGSGDVMYFRKKWLGYTDFEGSYSTPRTGCYSYTSPSAFQVPMGTYVYETKVIRSGITTYVYDTVVVSETGVVTINIDY